MKFIQEFFEGCRVSGIYLCKHKQAAVTKNGKPYENVILQDKTGTIDAKIWDPNSLGIDDFETLDALGIANIFGKAPEHFYINYLSVNGGIVSSR